MRKCFLGRFVAIQKDTTDKKEHIFDRIKESIDIFVSQSELFGTILMSAVAVLTKLITGMKIMEEIQKS